MLSNDVSEEENEDVKCVNIDSFAVFSSTTKNCTILNV